MMELDRQKTIGRLIKKQQARRDRPKTVRNRLVWVAHAQDCPRCSGILAQIHARHELFMDRMKPKDEDQKLHEEAQDQAMKLFTNLGCKL